MNMFKDKKFYLVIFHKKGKYYIDLKELFKLDGKFSDISLEDKLEETLKTDFYRNGDFWK